MKLLLDSSVWVEHLRRGVLDEVLPALRGRFALWIDSVVVAELLAGCRGKEERRTVEQLLAPFERVGRIATPGHADFARAAGALSALRARGKTLANPGGALLDALIVSTAARIGAMVVSANNRDFASLAARMRVPFDALPAFVERVRDR